MALPNRGNGEKDSIITPTGIVSTKPKLSNNIFIEIQNEHLALTHFEYLQHLEDLHEAVLNPNRFKKLTNKEIDKIKKEIIKLEKIKADRIKIIENKDKLRKLGQKQAICLSLAIKFRQEVEGLKSPQDVDAYIVTINEHIYDLLGHPSDEHNPILAEKYADLLKHTLDKFQKNQKNKKKNPVVLKQDISPGDIPLVNLGQTEPITDWEDARFVVDPLKREIKRANLRAQMLQEACIKEASQGDKNQLEIIKKKYEILNSMKDYAEKSKLNFDRRNNFSTVLYSAYSFFSILSKVATFTRAIPGANLIADGVSKTLDSLSYAFLTASQAVDPNVTKGDKLAAKRHFEVMKNYNITETAVASVGTLSLAFGLSVVALGAAPIFAPILFLAGGLTLTVSNIISSERYRKEIKWLNSELTRQYGDLLSRKEEILSTNFHELKTDREKSFYRDAKKIEACKWSYEKKISDAMGTAVATTIALGVLLTLAFPPAGAIFSGTVLTTLAITTALVSLYSLYQGYRESKNHKQFREAESAIEKEEINLAIKNGNKEKVTEQPKPKEESELQEMQPAPAYTPSFTAVHLPHHKPASESELKNKKEDEEEGEHPTRLR